MNLIELIAFIFYVEDNEDSNQRTGFRQLSSTDSTPLNASDGSSYSTKPISNTMSIMQPDILTHGNQSNIKSSVSEDPDQNQTPVTDKKTMSSLYVDMMHDVRQSIVQSSNHEVNSNNRKRNYNKIDTIPVFVSVSCVPIDSKQSIPHISTINKTQEIRLGDIFYYIKIKTKTHDFYHFVINKPNFII